MSECVYRKDGVRCNYWEYECPDCETDYEEEVVD